MLYQILIIIGFVFVAVFIIVLLRFILHLEKILSETEIKINKVTESIVSSLQSANEAMQEIKISINNVANNFSNTEKNVAGTLIELNKLIINANESLPEIKKEVNTFVTKTIEVISPMKSVVDTVSAPITGVQKYTSAVGKFIGAFREKLKSNKRN